MFYTLKYLKSHRKFTKNVEAIHIHNNFDSSTRSHSLKTVLKSTGLPFFPLSHDYDIIQKNCQHTRLFFGKWHELAAQICVACQNSVFLLSFFTAFFGIWQATVCLDRVRRFPIVNSPCIQVGIWIASILPCLSTGTDSESQRQNCFMICKL